MLSENSKLYQVFRHWQVGWRTEQDSHLYHMISYAFYSFCLTVFYYLNYQYIIILSSSDHQLTANRETQIVSIPSSYGLFCDGISTVF